MFYLDICSYERSWRVTMFTVYKFWYSMIFVVSTWIGKWLVGMQNNHMLQPSIGVRVKWVQVRLVLKKKYISAILTSSSNISNRFVPDQIKYFGSLTKIKHFIKSWSPSDCPSCLCETCIAQVAFIWSKT